MKIVEIDNKYYKIEEIKEEELTAKDVLNFMKEKEDKRRSEQLKKEDTDFRSFMRGLKRSC